MRLALLALLAVTLAACQPSASDAPADAEPRALATAAPPALGALAVRIDSLLIDEPDLNYTVAIGYPQLDSEGALPDAVRAVNAAVVDSVEALAADFRPEAPPADADRPEYRVEVDAATEQPFVGDGVFSALVQVYAYTGGAHGTTFFLPLTFDLETGAALAPADLFRPGTPWADTLAAHVDRTVRARLVRNAGEPISDTNYYPEGLDSIREGRVDLTLGPDSLTVHIPPYQLSYYAAGAFHVAVPLSAVAPFARGALARLAER